MKDLIKMSINHKKLRTELMSDLDATPEQYVNNLLKRQVRSYSMALDKYNYITSPMNRPLTNWKKMI